MVCGFGMCWCVLQCKGIALYPCSADMRLRRLSDIRWQAVTHQVECYIPACPSMRQTVSLISALRWYMILYQVRQWKISYWHLHWYTLDHIIYQFVTVWMCRYLSTGVSIKMYSRLFQGAFALTVASLFSGSTLRSRQKMAIWSFCQGERTLMWRCLWQLGVYLLAPWIQSLFVCLCVFCWDCWCQNVQRLQNSTAKWKDHLNKEQVFLYWCPQRCVQWFVFSIRRGWLGVGGWDWGGGEREE